MPGIARRLLLIAVLLAAGLPRAAAADSGPVDWTQSPASGPAPRVQAYLAYDAGRQRTVLFGGAPTSSGAYFSDTWELAGNSWTQVATTGPSARALGQMVYDSTRQVSVLFGGYSSATGYVTETWEWNGSAWTQRATANAPSARIWFGMTYDGNRHRVVLFGGTGPSSRLGDTWEYDDGNWTQVVTPHAPAARYGHGLAFDSGRNRVVMFGGHADSRLNDTWEYDGSDWVPVSTASAPAPRFWHSMGYDAGRGRTVVFGGDYLVPNALGPNNETWEYDGATWTQRLTTNRPSPRIEAPMAYDSAQSKLVIFGGSDESGRPDVALGDTWLLGPTPTAPSAALSVASVTFPPQPVLTSANRAVSLTNTGDLPLTISSIAAGGDFGESDDCPRTPAALAGGAACTITVSFSPTTGDGVISGSLRLVDNAGSGSQSIPLSGTGQWGHLDVTPAPIDFGSSNINLRGATATVSVSLVADAQPTLITGFEASGPFQVANLDCPLNTPLSYGAGCHVQLAFVPAAPGSYTGQFLVHDNEPGSLRSTALAGTAVAPPAAIQIGVQSAVSVPMVAHPLSIQVTSDAASGQANISFAGVPVAGPVDLGPNPIVVTFNLDDAVIPQGAGTYPLTVSIHSTDPGHSDATATQAVTVVPENVSVRWQGTSLGTAGQPANLSVTVQPPPGDAHFVDFNRHQVWARFEVTDPAGATADLFAEVKDVTTPSGFAGAGTASVSGPALMAGAYQVRVTLVAAPQSGAGNRYATGDDLRTAFAAHPVHGGWLAGAGEQSDGVAFDFTTENGPAGSLVATRPTQVIGAGGTWVDAIEVFTSTSVQSLSSKKGTVTVTGQISRTIVDAVSGAPYAAFNQTTPFTLTIDASGSIDLYIAGEDFGGTLVPGGVVNHL